MDVACTGTSNESFNPLPSQKQGETRSWRLARPYGGVSIRSPHKSKGRLSVLLAKPAVNQFQSAPLTKARGDRLPPYLRRSRCGFNPLPSQKQGETSVYQHDIDRLQVSIRSPHKSKGRLARIAHRVHALEFQSAPLTKARGDPRVVLTTRASIQFQSAPLTKARGDSATVHTESSFCPVSIRSPHKSKGRPA